MSEKASLFTYLQDYGIDLRARRVYLHHAITLSEESHEIGTEYVLRNLLYLDKTQGLIELFINSPGGDFGEMWAIIDAIETARNPVITVAFGAVSSCACLILASGTGTRYAMPNATFMWHAGTTGVNGTHWPDARDRMAAEAREKDRWLDAMSHKTKPRHHGKQIKTLAGRRSFWEPWVEKGGELYLSAAEMVSHGVVDEIWVKP